jgi:hypothetical protein
MNHNSSNRKPSHRRNRTRVGVGFGIAVLVASIAPAGAQSRAVRAEVARLGSLYAAATPGSPAQFRIHEELDKLYVVDADLPSSPADFRVFEEAKD